MSRYADDRYDDRRTNVSRRPRYEDEEYEVRSRYDGPAPSRRPPAETMVRERDADTVISQGRRGGERPSPRQPDFLREDYGRNPNAGPLVLREERREDDYVSRAPTRRRSMESVRSRGPPGPPERTEKLEFSFRERDSESRGPPYPRSERGGGGYDEKEEISFRDTRSRAPPPSNRGGGYEEKTEIRFREDEKTEWMPPRRENRDRDVEEIRFRRGGGDRPSPPPQAPTAPPPRTELDREEFTFTRRERSRERPMPGRFDETEEITFTHRETSRERSRAPPPPRSTYDREEIEFRERRSSPPRQRGRHDHTDIDIDIDINHNERGAPPPRQRSQSRGQLVGRKHEEWIVRRERTPTPPPPQKDFEREQIVIRTRRERTPSPEPPPREPTPEPTPPPPPPPEPIYRPPIIQEVITHHRTIDHGVERARSPTPPPPPAPLPPPPPETKEDDLEIEIKRTGTRNGRPYEEDIRLDIDRTERDAREPSRQRERSAGPRRARSFSRERVDNREIAIRSKSRYDDRVGPRWNDEVAAEADYYNRKVSSRGYPGEAYNGATKDWGLVDIPPGTQRVAMDGVGGGRQELTWDRYAGDRHGKFYAGDRVYEQDYGRERNGYQQPAPLPPPAPAPERQRGGQHDDVHIDIKINEETRSGKTKDKMWTEITKDLVIKEAIEERGYEYEETDDFFYVMVYLRYEDVLRLVETTEDIRRQRRERIREIQWEREELDRPKPKQIMPPPPPPPMIPPPPIREARGGYDERIVEREYYHDRHGTRGGYR